MSNHPNKSEEKRLQRAIDRRRPVRAEPRVGGSKNTASPSPRQAGSRTWPKG